MAFAFEDSRVTLGLNWAATFALVGPGGEQLTCIASHDYTVLCYTMLYYTILYCTALYCTALYCTIYCTILYYTILYYTILYYTIRFYYDIM